MGECTTMFDCLSLAFSWIDAICLDWFIFAGKFLFVVVPAAVAFGFVGHYIAHKFQSTEGFKDLMAFLFTVFCALVSGYLVGTIAYCMVIVFMGGF